MALINWIIGTSGSAERLVGINNNTYQDVLNRPVRQIVSLSLSDPDQDFQGFALTTHSQFAPSIFGGVDFNDPNGQFPLGNAYSFDQLFFNIGIANILAASASILPDIQSAVNIGYGSPSTFVGLFNPTYLTFLNQVTNQQTFIIGPFGRAFIGSQIPLLSDSSSYVTPTTLSADFTVFGIASASAFSASQATINQLIGTASLAVTAAFAANAITPVTVSFATTASAATSLTFVPNLASTASFIAQVPTASYATQSLSASYALSASHANIADNVLGSITSSSFATTASFALTSAGTITNAVSASFSTTASFALTSAGVITNASTASYVQAQNVQPGIYPSGTFVVTSGLLPSSVVFSVSGSQIINSLLIVSGGGGGAPGVISFGGFQAAQNVVYVGVYGASVGLQATGYVGWTHFGDNTQNASSSLTSDDPAAAATGIVRLIPQVAGPTIPNAFRIYSTGKTTTNSERAFIGYYTSSGPLAIGTEPIGSGSIRPIAFMMSQSQVAQVKTDGGISASYFVGDGSQLHNVISASFASNASAISASQVLQGTYASGTYTYTGSLVVSGALYNSIGIVYVTGSHTQSLTDQMIVVDAGATTASVYLLPLVSQQGTELIVKKDDNGKGPVIIVPNGTDTVDYQAGRVLFNQTDGAVLVGTRGTWMSDGFITGSVPVSASYALTASFALNAGSGGGGGASTNNPILITPTASVNPTSGTLQLYAKQDGGSDRPAWVAFNDEEHLIQTDLIATKTCLVAVRDGSLFAWGGYTPSGFGAAGSISLPNTANLPQSRYLRKVFTTSNISGSFSSNIGGIKFMNRGCGVAGFGGFRWKALFTLENFDAGQSLFVGISSAATSFTYCSASVPSLVNNQSAIALAKDTADTTLQLMTCDGNTVTKQDTGLTANQNAIYQITIQCNPNDTVMYMKLEDLSTIPTTVLFNSSTSTTLPNSGAFMREELSVNTSRVAIASVGVIRYTIETND